MTPVVYNQQEVRRTSSENKDQPLATMDYHEATAHSWFLVGKPIPHKTTILATKTGQLSTTGRLENKTSHDVDQPAGDRCLRNEFNAMAPARACSCPVRARYWDTGQLLSFSHCTWKVSAILWERHKGHINLMKLTAKLTELGFRQAEWPQISYYSVTRMGWKERQREEPRDTDRDGGREMSHNQSIRESSVEKCTQPSD